MEAVDQLRRPMPPVAGNQAGEVDREKTAGAERLRAESEQRPRHGEDRIEAEASSSRLISQTSVNPAARPIAAPPAI